MKQTLIKSKNHFCSTFDLTKSIPQNIIDNALMRLINVNELSENSYHTLLDRIRNVIEENHLNSLLIPPSNDIFAFLHALRGLLRFSFGVAVITIPAYIYTSSSSNCVRSLEKLNTCDAVVEVESFASRYSNDFVMVPPSFLFIVKINLKFRLGYPATTNAIYSVLSSR
ncbi:11611_t:CDS:2 [Funneliformis caledonium]|uniref:Elongator complex protein 4 n=1 Tax=Funneliformis caledonium TaxID=1117310 RepID=A0A9N9HR94_9GLOM|nr:11611_t:CDS:2 [Funneliformis caledonium]